MEKDYNREYSIVEVYEFPDGTEFISEEVKYKIFCGDLYYFSDYESQWRESVFPLRVILNMKFKLARKDKKVSFEEAVKEKYDGKCIYCRLHGIIYTYESGELIGEELIDEIGNAITAEEILVGEWFVKEEE